MRQSTQLTVLGMVTEVRTRQAENMPSPRETIPSGMVRCPATSTSLQPTALPTARPVAVSFERAYMGNQNVVRGRCVSVGIG